MGKKKGVSVPACLSTPPFTSVPKKGKNLFFLLEAHTKMKRGLAQRDDDDDDNFSEPMFVGSPTHKQARLDDGGDDGDGDNDTGATPGPWNADAAVADLEALCARISERSADADDLYEALRLALGASGGGLAGTHAVGTPMDPLGPAGPAQTPTCASLVEPYRELWETLGEDRFSAALATVRAHAAGWPPTFADAVRTYEALDPQAARAHVYRLAQRALDFSMSDVAQELVAALEDAAQRRAALDAAGTSPFEGFIDPFAGGDWDPALEPDGSARLPGCDSGTSYFVFENDAEEGMHMALFAVAPQARMATLVASVLVPASLPATTVQSFVPVPRPDRRGQGALHIPAALGPYYRSLLPLFLAAVASPHEHEPYEDERETYAADFALTSALLDPTPAGAQQIKSAMLPLGSEFALPDPVQHFIKGTYADPYNVWYYGDMRGAWIDECRLVLALRLFEGQVAARRAALGYVSPSLTNLAARAYAGPLRAGVAPDEMLDRAAAYAWQGVCAAPALTSGRLASADRLSDVALWWGIEPNDAETLRPELLCGRLAGIAAERRDDATLSSM
ncbi:hypothetical protein psal_cds_172 [Pandoravirus salinus]|uniref:Uncharacterized protein n=1 Tax=Pandoravirus salinus TaxID=1349410 RepID=S4VW53_9VIRU|nr:hypothetical protein psal_cds_172 [Pandoravirus salinus]AGO83661.2 hypothetical protein psal_cds_172 [Pandoravirus salinus]